MVISTHLKSSEGEDRSSMVISTYLKSSEGEEPQSQPDVSEAPPSLTSSQMIGFGGPTYTSPATTRGVKACRIDASLPCSEMRSMHGIYKPQRSSDAIRGAQRPSAEVVSSPAARYGQSTAGCGCRCATCRACPNYAPRARVGRDPPRAACGRDDPRQAPSVGHCGCLAPCMRSNPIRSPSTTTRLRRRRGAQLCGWVANRDASRIGRRWHEGTGCLVFGSLVSCVERRTSISQVVLVIRRVVTRGVWPSHAVEAPVVAGGRGLLQRDTIIRMVQDDLPNDLGGGEGEEQGTRQGCAWVSGARGRASSQRVRQVYETLPRCSLLR